MESDTEFKIKIKTMDEAIFEFNIDPKDKVLSLKEKIKDVIFKFLEAKLDQIMPLFKFNFNPNLGAWNPYLETEDSIHG